jgi:transcriptional regulator with XRE-family HTH domain
VTLTQCLQANIRSLRKGQKLTQTQLAEKMGIDYKDFQKLESGKGINPTLKTLDRLAKALKTDASELLKRS